MEILSFLLGICAVIVVTLVTVVVAGMFKISRLNKELNNLERLVDTVVNQLDQRITLTEDDLKRGIDSRVDSLRSIIEKELKATHERIGNSYQELVNETKFVHERINGLGKVK